jgi:quercetin dioxygenase-like cupin family protein
MSQPPIERRELLKTVFENGTFTSADIREIQLQPGQQSGRHLHPCAVLGYIGKGTATYQIEGEAERILPAGSAFHEPAGRDHRQFRQPKSLDIGRNNQQPWLLIWLLQMSLVICRS